MVRQQAHNLPTRVQIPAPLPLKKMKLTLYAIKSKDEKYFRAKGYGGYGKSWVDDINKARLYTTISPAKAQVTFWANNYPEYGIPTIVVIEGKIVSELKQDKRVEKNKETEKRRMENRRKLQAKRLLKKVQLEYDRLL